MRHNIFYDSVLGAILDVHIEVLAFLGGIHTPAHLLDVSLELVIVCNVTELLKLRHIRVLSLEGPVLVKIHFLADDSANFAVVLSADTLQLKFMLLSVSLFFQVRDLLIVQID